METSILETMKAGKMVSVDVEVFDPHYNRLVTTDLYTVKNSRGREVVIAPDASNQLFAVTANGDKLVLDNTNGFGTIDYVNHTVSGWNFDRENLCTTPVGFKSSGYYAK